jgi:hypothetical protein
MLALVGTVMLRSASGEPLLSDGGRVLGTHTLGWLPDIPSQFTHFASPALLPIIAVVNGADLHLYVMEKD